MATKQPRTLADYFTLQRGTTYKSMLLGQPGPVLLGLATIQRNGGFRSDSLKTYGGESPDKLLVRPGELYLSLKDVTQSADLLGAVARLPLEHSVGRLTQDTVKLEPKNEKVPLDYLYWLLRTPVYREYCRAHATGTTNLGLARDDFLAFPVPEQTPVARTIATVLNALDDKIELNRRMNETLEMMARALFKSWFVDFDPVRAKSQGRDPGLPSDIADLFPDSFEESELGEIPKSWKCVPLLNRAILISGGTPKTDVEAYWDGSIAWASAKDVSQCPHAFLVSTERSITQRGLDESSTKLIPERATIVVARGATTGRFCMTGQVMAMNQTCYALKSQEGAPFWLNCAFESIVDKLVHAAHGSVFDTITTRTIESAVIVSTPTAVVSCFERTIEPLFEMMLQNIKSSATTAALRDTLLPKLNSGELHVSDVEING